MADINEKIIDAIQTIASNLISNAGYDKTIQGQVISCEDKTIGKYKCKSQDAIFYAYSSNINMTYPNNAYVYILVPNGDMSKEKTILSTTSKVGINYINTQTEQQRYAVIGKNCISNNSLAKFYLDTNNIDYKYTIYDKEANENDIEIDIQGLQLYIKQSSSLLIGATFKTQIPKTRQSRGQFGIRYNLRFLDNTTNTQVIRTYQINEDTMIGNPYKLAYPTRQYDIFDIDGQNFVSLQSIEIFNKDFPFAEGIITDQKLSSGDILISKVQICGMERIKQQELDSVTITFDTPKGAYFSQDSSEDDQLDIIAQIRVMGNLVSSDQNIPFYWGRQHVGINTGSSKYNQYLGAGWQCLNQFNIVTSEENPQDQITQWVPATNSYTVKMSDIKAVSNRFKVAIVYEGVVFSKEIIINNLNSEYTIDLSIQSDNGTEFYYDNGHPMLTCLVEGQDLPDDYTYYWGVQNSKGIFTPLAETASLNQQWESLVSQLQTLDEQIQAGIKFANAEATNRANLVKAIDEFYEIQRVDKNTIYDVQINQIANFSTFKCSVFELNSGDYIGTASIVLKNILQNTPGYRLEINNGNAVFKYDETGKAPNSSTAINKQVINPLSIVLYDNSGNLIQSKNLENRDDCKIRWSVPKNNTLITVSTQGENISSDDQYIYIDNNIELIYDIASYYAFNRNNNQIRLTVQYKDLILNAETNFVFTKEGQSGTNGTDYLIKIVPNTFMISPPNYPMITQVGDQENDTFILNYGLGNADSETEISLASSYQLFKAQVWHNGELEWQGFSAGTAASLVEWSILSNKYNSSNSDSSFFEITNANNGSIKIKQGIDSVADPQADIIKCHIMYDSQDFYGTIPITTAWVKDENYKVFLKENTGFRSVLYSSGGVSPQYVDSSFEFVCHQKINNIWEDISVVGGTHEIFYWTDILGSVYTNSGFSDVVLLNDMTPSSAPVNQFRYKPVTYYDGECVNASVVCEYYQGNEQELIGTIMIPIHFLLNKYGLSQLNDWDGNSIEINSDGGYILSPQMGAGSKDNNNNFTGVLMGQVKQSNLVTQTGLFGYSEGIRSFFIDSETGGAIFGKSSGKITIDPNSSKAMIYSNDFWKNYDNKGFPSSYSSSNENGSGMLIDLTTPCIRWGNGNVQIKSTGEFSFGNSTAGTITLANNSLSIDAKTIKIGGVTVTTTDDLKKYLVYQSAKGLMLANMTSGAKTISNITTPNTWLTGTQMKIRNGQTQLATFSGSGIVFNNSNASLQIKNGSTTYVNLNKNGLNFYTTSGGLSIACGSNNYSIFKDGYILLANSTSQFSGRRTRIERGYIYAYNDSGGQLELTPTAISCDGTVSGNSLSSWGSITADTYVSAGTYVKATSYITAGTSITAGGTVKGNIIQGNGVWTKYTSGQADCGVQGTSGNLYLYSSNASPWYKGLYFTGGASGSAIIVEYSSGAVHFYGTLHNQASDLKKKNIISDYNWQIDDFINNLKPIAFRFKDGNRIHFGFGAQDVRDLAKAMNLGDLSMYKATILKRNEKNEEYEDYNYHGEPIDDKKLSWQLTYTQLIAPIVLQLQNIMKRLKKIQKKLEIKYENS